MNKAVKLPKWDKDREATLISIVGDVQPVVQDIVANAAESLKTSTRSIASKLRNLGYEVESTAKVQGKSYTADEEAEITDFLEANQKQFTYAEIAAQILNGTRSAKQIQGKILSMELFGSVKATEKVERVKTYTDEEEIKILGLVRAGEFIEDIAQAMDREVNSIRGKILSMSRVHDDISIPKQRVYKTKQADAFEELGDVSEMTVEAIATSIGKSERGIKTILTHRGVDCADYKGAKRHDKIAEANAAA